MKLNVTIQKEDYPLAMAFCLALFFIGTIYLLLQAASGFEGMSYVEADQTLYMQYARNMATGHPYVFTLGDAPSTGSTSHLYPWILAGLYKLGAHGNTFFVAIFWLNAFFYVGMIFSVWLIAKKLVPKLTPFAVFLTVISGQTLTTFFGGTDMGLFSFLALTLFAALLYEKKKTAILLATLCGATRPEGFVFAIAALLIGGFLLVYNRKKRKEEYSTAERSPSIFLLTGIAGLLAFLFVLIINYQLTSYFQFMSVMNKGHFMHYSFFEAIRHTLYDFIDLIMSLFFGLHGKGRQFLGIPILSGLLGISGVLLFVRSKKIALREWWFLLVTGAVFLTISMSGWQGISNDRYLGWFFPIWSIYILIGAKKWSQFFNSQFVFSALVVLLFGFQLISTCIAFDYIYSSGVETNQFRLFAKELDKKIPINSIIGTGKQSGMQYFLPHQRLWNLSGILTPDLFVPHVYTTRESLFEYLKHNPKRWVTYWLLEKNEVSYFKNMIKIEKSGIMKSPDLEFVTGDSLLLYSASWRSLKGGDTPLLSLANLTLVDQIDVGYNQDEIDHSYKKTVRFGGVPNDRMPFVSKFSLLGKNKNYFEAGYLILGSESFQIRNAHINTPLLAVLRTSLSIKTISLSRSNHLRLNYNLNNKIKLLVSVDGDEPTPIDLELNEKGFCEVKIPIAGNRIHSTRPRITIYGDHISFAYWFYQ